MILPAQKLDYAGGRDQIAGWLCMPQWFERRIESNSCWLLVAGCWLLVAGHWLLASGCWICLIFDT